MHNIIHRGSTQVGPIFGVFVRLGNFKLSTLTPVALAISQAMTLTTKFTLSTALVHGNSSLSLTRMGLRIHCLTCVDLECPVNSEIKSDILKVSQVLRMDKYLEYMYMHMYMHVHIIKLTSMVWAFLFQDLQSNISTIHAWRERKSLNS